MKDHKVSSSALVRPATADMDVQPAVAVSALPSLRQARASGLVLAVWQALVAV
jgi:hypothetical protein